MLEALSVVDPARGRLRLVVTPAAAAAEKFAVEEERFGLAHSRRELAGKGPELRLRMPGRGPRRQPSV